MLSKSSGPLGTDSSAYCDEHTGDADGSAHGTLCHFYLSRNFPWRSAGLESHGESNSVSFSMISEGNIVPSLEVRL